jgi:hypothetical protein
MRERFREADTVDRCQDVDALGRIAQLNDIVRFAEIVDSDIKTSKAERIKGIDDLLRILGSRLDPDI